MSSSLSYVCAHTQQLCLAMMTMRKAICGFLCWVWCLGHWSSATILTLNKYSLFCLVPNGLILLQLTNAITWRKSEGCTSLLAIEVSSATLSHVVTTTFWYFVIFTLILAMEELCTKQDDILTTKDAKIKELKLRLLRQKQFHQQQLSDLDIHRQQEQYINYTTQKSQENNKKTRQKRVSFRWPMPTSRHLYTSHLKFIFKLNESVNYQFVRILFTQWRRFFTRIGNPRERVRVVLKNKCVEEMLRILLSQPCHDAWL